MYTLFSQFTTKIKVALLLSVLCFLATTPLVADTPITGTGLVGSYYNKTSSTYNNAISGTPNLTRTDSTISFEWGDSPASGINANYFQVRWTGYVYIPTTGTWTFYTQSDDGVRLSVNGTSLVDNWTNHSSTENSGTRTLNVGYYPVVMDLFENTGGAVAKLSWSGPGVTKQIIPTANLFRIIPPALNYRFDECSLNGTSGEIKDSSSNNYNGTVSGTPTPQVVTQIINNGVSFQRTNQHYVQLPSLPISKPDFSDGFTVTTWAKFSATAGSWERIFDFGNGDTNNNIFLGRKGTEKTLIFNIYASDGSNNPLEVANAIDANWHFWAVTCSGTTCKLYKDGTQIATSSTMKVPSNIARTRNYIGKSNWNDAYFEGGIDEFKIFDENLSASQISTIHANELAKKNYDGTTRGNPCGYCAIKSLSTGYYIISPDNNSSHSFEIYCDRSNVNDIKDVIKLPLSNQMGSTEFSNFKFNASLGTSKNYYDASKAKTYINYIRIDAHTLEIIPDDSSGFFDGEFSNLNLKGTPFTFDWDNMSASNIEGCTLSKMRRDYDSSTQAGGQVLKINPKQEDVYKCTGKNLKLKLLDEYKFVIDGQEEVLKQTCRSLSETLPSDGEYANITGYFYIDPKNIGRKANQSLSDYRPFVAYCMEVAGSNTEDQYSWTMFLTLDGKRTRNHTDIPSGVDTCTNLGLIFYVPNSQVTYNKVKSFLYSQKNQWKEYTGKMGEYFSDRGISGWGYNESGPNQAIRYYWPYGPMGLYYANGASSDWHPTIENGRMISNKKYGYDLTSSSEINGTSINIAHLSNGNGWKTTLSDLNITDDFWITDKAAGKFTNSAPLCSGANTNGCYLNDGEKPGAIPEPNGDYDQGNWLHFWADDNGDIYHYNDQNGDRRYTHDHYMCIAKDNYSLVSRYKRVKGPFKAIEHTVASGNEATDTSIQTKIVNAPIQLDIAILNDQETALSPDKNVSVGIFLDEFYTSENVEMTRDIHYFGDIKMNGSGTFNALKSTGRFEIPAAAWPSNSKKITSAYKQLLIKFKYCSTNTMEWTGCWTKSGNTATCTSGCTPNADGCSCKYVDSDDYFAVRPDKFDFDIAGISPYKAGKPYDITFYAKDYNNNATQNYNESAPFTYPETKAGCITGDYNTSLTAVPLTNGSTTLKLAYSEVGVINVKMEEIAGSEFALIDASDTVDTQRYITPYDQNWTYTPDHFSLATSTFKNYNDGTFTYISNDLNMFSELNITIVAQKFDDNATTRNYNSACYAKATDYNISYDALTISPADSLTQVKFIETNTATTGNSLISTKLTINDVNKTIFGTDNNGTGKLHFKLNFDRNSTKVVNPIKLTLRDLNVTDDDTIAGSSDINQSALFYYGRVYSTDYRGQSPIATAIRYEVYCKDCNTTTFPAIGLQSPTSLNWYTNPLHVNRDGNVTTFSSLGTTRINNLNQTTSGNINQGAETNNLSNALVPYTDRILMRPSPWLLYNPYNAGATTNDFTAEFIRAGNWAGQGQLGETVDINTSVRTNRRMEW